MRAVQVLAVSWSLLGACAPVLSTSSPGGATTPDVPTEVVAPPAHPVILAYRETLRPFLDDEENADLDAVATDGTMRGDSQRLRYIAADRTIRRLLPLALEAHGDSRLDAHAARLRRLPPLLNRDVDFVVQPVVADAMRALRLHREGDAAVAAPDVGGAGRVAVGPSADPLHTVAGDAAGARDAAEHADAMAEYAEAYARAFGTSTLGADAATAAAADAIDAGFLVRRAIEEYGADRSRVLDTVRETLSAMADAARRRERMPMTERDRTADRTDP